MLNQPTKEIEIFPESCNVVARLRNGFGPTLELQFWAKHDGRIVKFVVPLPYLQGEKVAQAMCETLAKVHLTSKGLIRNIAD